MFSAKQKKDLRHLRFLFKYFCIILFTFCCVMFKRYESNNIFHLCTSAIRKFVPKLKKYHENLKLTEIFQKTNLLMSRLIQFHTLFYRQTLQPLIKCGK